MLAGVAADAGGRAARARSRRRHLRLAQPARVQRRQVLRPRRPQAHRRGRGGDRGAARRARARRRRDRPRRRRRRQLPRARPRALRLRPLRACGSPSTARTAPTPASRRTPSSSSAPRSTAIGDAPDGDEHQRRLRRDRPRRAAATSCAAAASTSASPSTATATGCSPSTSTGESVDGDQIVAILALDLGVDLVAVTTMTNLGFHRLMEERGIRVVTTDVGDRYVLEALRPRGRPARRRAVGPHHLPRRPRHRRRPRRGAAALPRARGRPLVGGRRRDAALPAGEAERAAVDARAAPAGAARRGRRASTRSSTATGRVLVRPSGTEPVVRVLAEAESGGGGGPLW